MSQPTKARHGATTNHHREAGKGIIPTSRQENKEEIYNDQQENGEREVMRLISEMSDKQIMITFEAFNIQLEDETKTPEECVMLARERLSKEEKR